MSILKPFAASPQEREDYLKAAPWKGEAAGERILSETRSKQFAEAEEFILTVTANGYGKRSSAYEYRRTSRGGQGIRNIAESDRNGPVLASFPAHDGDEIMLVTNQGKLIRLTVGHLRVIGRASQGVKLFDVAKDEHVVSAAKIGDSGDDDDAAVPDGADSGPTSGGPDESGPDDSIDDNNDDTGPATEPDTGA